MNNDTNIPATRTACTMATSRDAGRNVVHTVTSVWDDGTPIEVVGATRRSAHRYAYAICRYVRGHGERYVVVDRWSGSSKCRRDQFAVTVRDITNA